MTQTKGLSALSASLQVTPSWVVLFTHLKDGMPARRINKTKCKVLHLHWGNSHVNTSWGMKGSRAVCWQGFGSAGGQEAGHDPPMCTQPRRSVVSWAASKAAWAARWKRGFSPSALVRPYLRPALGSSAQKGLLEQVQRRPPKLLKEWSTGRTGIVQSGKEKASGWFNRGHPVPEGNLRERLFTRTYSDKDKGEWFQIETKFSLDIR